jgi:hypothetical protein
MDIGYGGWTAFFVDYAGATRDAVRTLAAVLSRS